VYSPGRRAAYLQRVTGPIHGALEARRADPARMASRSRMPWSAAGGKIMGESIIVRRREGKSPGWSYRISTGRAP
jgi:hypothetical protein